MREEGGEEGVGVRGRGRGGCKRPTKGIVEVERWFILKS